MPDDATRAQDRHLGSPSDSASADSSPADGGPALPGATILDQPEPDGDAARGAQTSPLAAAGRYQLAGEIARGGMGAVYRATDLILGREVAVKVLQDRYASDLEAARRFIDEARVTGQLQHPAIPAVHDLGTFPDGRPFLAMKLIKGWTLHQLLRERSEPGQDRSRFLGIFEQVCQAVAFAHDRHVVHRDLKPANVMVGTFGEVQVMDWGLAKILPADGEAERSIDALAEVDEAEGVTRIQFSASAAETHAGSVLGTFAYMPPEQAMGAVGQTDRRSDVFGLGAILCTILTGKPPYLGATSEAVRVEAARGKVDEAFARLDGCGADAELIALCRRCLAVEKADRPADAGAVARAMADLRAAAEERLRQAERERAAAEARAAEQVKRRRVQAALGMTFTVLVVLGVFAFWWIDRREQAARAERQRGQDQRRQAAKLALDQAEKALRANDGRTADTALTEARSRLGDDTAVELYELHERLASLSRDLAMLEALEYLMDGSWSPRLERLAAVHKLEVQPNSLRALYGSYGLDLHTGDPSELAERIDRSPIRQQLLDGIELSLDQIKLSSLNADMEPRVALEVLHRLDGDPVRDPVRAAIGGKQASRLAALAPALDGARLPPVFAASVGFVYQFSDADRRRILTAAVEQRPGYYPLRLALARVSSKPTDEDVERAIDHAQIAIALRPQSAKGYMVLAGLLRWKKDGVGAVAACTRALTLASSFQRPEVMRNLVPAVKLRDGRAGAVAYFRKLTENDGDDALSHYFLGLVLREEGDRPGAIAALRQAAKLLPTSGAIHAALGGQLDSPAGDPEEALAEYRLARCERKPWHWYEWVHLGHYLRRTGKYREALEADEELLAVFPWVVREPLSHAMFCARFNTACSAALAGTKGGSDPYPQAEWPALRRKALNYLRADLALIRELIAHDPDVSHAAVNEMLKRWLAVEPLAAVRDPAALGRLPAEEQQSWRVLWAEVIQLREKATELGTGLAK